MYRLLLSITLCLACLTASAQRFTDKLDRGLVAVKTSGGVLCSWRMDAAEYYDTRYNIYRDGTKLNAEPIAVNNYKDASGTATSTYQVEAVRRGKAGQKCAAVQTWAKNYLEVPMTHPGLTSTYVPNDACCADVDGDGQVEILLKFDNLSEIQEGYMPNGHNGEYAIMEVYKLDGTRLWWIDLGPNMSDFQNNEQNIVGYDWDQDGRAEVVLRASDGTVIHRADGTTQQIGDMTKNYRSPNGGGGANYFIHDGQEFLLYLNGETGYAYQTLPYPLKRLEDGETDLNKAWGDGYGHRSTKHFFGAPYLDGRHPSIFLARGIYTRHKMIAYDVNPATHALTERWRWNCNTGGTWFGQGYHNYSVADVDWDGRDEICFGSMVIDDNGHGLSTTGLGHGDSQHVGDFDPFTHGQEIFACNEDNPGNNFRDATTSKLYYRYVSGKDDGRANCGNFIDDIPGAQAVSSADPDLVNCVTHKANTTGSKGNYSITQNFRIYWDGDLCDETFDYVNGKNTEGGIFKAQSGRIATLEGSMTNNDTKGTPCYQGDILGDWREEVIMRTADNNIRIYTTDITTTYPGYSLWYDHQYRNAMVWQMCGYNQTPHISYFWGRKEGLTRQPAPLSMEERTEIANGGSIASAANDRHIITCETGDMTVSVADGATPYIYTDNAPTWVQGHDNNNNITTTTYTHTLTGGAFAGAMRLVKQGDGILRLPAVTEAYSGPTEVWAGTLTFDGTMQNSRVWLGRFARLATNGGTFQKTVQADYGAEIEIGGQATFADTLALGFGAAVKLALPGATFSAKTLTIGKCTWTQGPKYKAPVLRIEATDLPNGRYQIGTVQTVSGNLADITVEGLEGHKATLSAEGTGLYLDVQAYVPGATTWAGTENGSWDLDETANFSAADGSAETFVSGDSVTFDDNATNTNITVAAGVHPGSVTFNNQSKSYTLSGESLMGGFPLTKHGAGRLTINTTNEIAGAMIDGGTVQVKTFGNAIGQDLGALGAKTSTITLDGGATLIVADNATSGQPIKVGEGGATINVASGKRLTMATGIKYVKAASSTLTKKGDGALTLGTGNTFKRLIIAAGAVDAVEANNRSTVPAEVEFQGGSLWDGNSEGSSTTNSANFIVPEGKTGSLYADPRCVYNGKLTGAGTFNVYGTGVRDYFDGDWSQFEGTIVPGLQKRGSYNPTFEFRSDKGLPGATLKVNDGVSFNSSKTCEIGTVSGTGTLCGSGSYIIGSNDKDFSWTPYCTSPVTKRGTGKMTLTSKGRLTAALAVENGTLALMDGTQTEKITGDNTITIRGTGTLSGYAYINAVSVSANGAVEIYSAVTGTPNTLKTAAAFSATGNSIVRFRIKGTKNSKLNIGSNLTLTNIEIELDAATTPKDGDTYTLWTCKSLTKAPASISLPTLPEGLYWDTTGLSGTTGTLTVTSNAAMGIDNVKTTATDDARVYTADGKYLGTGMETLRHQGAGTYIIKSRQGARKVRK